MPTSVTPMSFRLPVWAIIPPTLYLFVLPFAHTIAIRWIALGLCVIVAVVFQPRITVPRVPCVIPIALWVVIAASSLLWARNPGYSLAEFRIDVLYALAGFFVVFILTQSEKVFYLLLCSILASAFTISATAIVGYLQAGKWVDDYQNFLGEFSTCMLMAMAVIPLLTLQKAHRLRTISAVVVTLIVVLGAGFCTRSRMFWISSFAMFVVAMFMWMHGKPAVMRTKIFAGFLLVAVVAAAGYIFAATRSEQLQLDTDPRIAIWHQALQNISEKPFTGAGFGRDVYKDRYETLIPGAGLYHSHNLFLSYGEQMGVQGTAVLVLLFFALLRESFRLWKMDDVLARNVGIACAALIVGVMVKSMTDTHFGREVTLYFWAIMGMLLGIGRRQTGASKTD